MAALPLEKEIDYPESDGRPLGETDWHRDEIVDLIYALRARYENDPDVYVSGNLFLYYVKGDSSKSVCPDVFLVEGVSKEQRPVYKVWEEGKEPSFVIEMASKKTWEEDLDTKKGKYSRIGVKEYFLFDPEGKYLDPRLLGFRLVNGRYRAVPAATDGSLVSEVTGLRLALDGPRLRLVDLATGENLPRSDEEREARKAAEAQRDAERMAREAAEAQRDAERVAREAAEAQRDAERLAREAAEARYRALEEEILRLRTASPKQP